MPSLVYRCLYLLTPGFSFQPPVRSPFDKVLNALAAAKKPVLSVDVPSGWGVEEGHQPLYDENKNKVETIVPEVLISLTAPKEGVKEFKGRHWLGGRFVPDHLSKQYELNLPVYPGVEQVVELPSQGKL